MSILHFANVALSKIVASANRILKPTYVPTMFNGSVVRVPREIWHSLYGRYEEYNASALREHLKPGAFFLDIGAHHGLWSLFACRLVGSGGLVVACEPSPAFNQLQLAAGAYPQMKALNVGVGSADGETTFFAQGDSSSGSFVKEVTEINLAFSPGVPVTAVPVKIKSVDTLVRELGRTPDLAKIDVEGFELEVLKGASQTLGNRTLRALILEIHPPQLTRSGGSERELMAILERNAFRHEVLFPNPNSLYTVLATRS